ncbi:MAG: LuxR C-terminal-related transcriptional regulator, partial [Actinomycetes bacterium]
VVFWTYIVAALNKAADGIGAVAFSMLDSPQPPIEEALATVLNDLSAMSNNVVLVLDDYHVIEAREVQDSVAFFVENLPEQAQLVIASRADPSLPLPRLRARAELVEIRAADLRFTPEEAAQYLNVMMGLALSAQDVAALEGRTEGWIAALQLAALSMQGRDDVAGFIAGFAGDDRYVVDYLAQEVLTRQPRDVRDFLLQTSILERLNGPLCDAVTDQRDGKSKLAALERGNLFLVPLDDRRQWYRYHQLFADVLQAHLLEEQPEKVPQLHLRASSWFEQNGHLPTAIRHALAAQDFERAADLVERMIPAIGRGRQEAVLQVWLEQLPPEVVSSRPELSISMVGALLTTTGDSDASPGRLQAAEQWLDITAQNAQLPELNDENSRRIPGMIEVYRAALAMARDDVPGAVGHSRRAFELLPEQDYLGRAASAGFIGLTSWTGGDLVGAHEAWSQCVVGLHQAGHVADTLGCTIALADIRIAQGRLGDAMRTYERALQLAPPVDGRVLRGTADMHVGMSGIYRERNDLLSAESELVRSEQLGEGAALPQNRYRERVAMAQLLVVRGDLSGAVELLDEAQRRYVGDYFPNVQPIPAIRARVFIAQGNVGGALTWATVAGLSADDELSYLHEFEHLTVARLLLAQGSIDEAAAFLGRLLRAAEQGQRTGSIIEILVLQALTDQAGGDIAAALASLRRALALAGPEGYVRVFISEGPAMVSLLKSAAKQGIAPSYTRGLLATVGHSGGAAPAQQGLVEPLSERELEVLRLLATDLSGPDIARELFVSLNTIRTHTKSIYAKLGVNNRRAAVRRAEELGLGTR